MLILPEPERPYFMQQHLSGYHSYKSFLREVWFMLLLTAVEVMVYSFYMVYYWNDWRERIHTNIFVYNSCARPEVWRLLTCILMHGGLTHLTFNMFSQIVLGLPLELVYGWWRVALVYLIGSIGGALFSSLTLHVPGTSLGASGALFALYAAIFANLAMVSLEWLTQITYFLL